VLLTNAYWSYAKYHELIDTKEKEVLSHYDFIKSVALAWIEPEVYDKKEIISNNTRKRAASVLEEEGSARRRGRVQRRMDSSLATSTTASTLTSATILGLSTATSSTRNATINDHSLHPSNGKLRCHLNTAVQHLPEVPKGKKHRCQLHRWARGREGKEAMSGIICCSICRVDLCVPCFQMFHKEANIIEKKKEIAAS